MSSRRTLKQAARHSVAYLASHEAADEKQQYAEPLPIDSAGRSRYSHRAMPVKPAKKTGVGRMCSGATESLASRRGAGRSLDGLRCPASEPNLPLRSVLGGPAPAFKPGDPAGREISGSHTLSRFSQGRHEAAWHQETSAAGNSPTAIIATGPEHALPPPEGGGCLGDRTWFAPHGRVALWPR